MYSFEISPHLQDILAKLLKKDEIKCEEVLKKIEEIINSPNVEHYKNLKHDLKDEKRVHAGHFVLTFSFIKNENRIVFLDFEHHDNIYGR
jgi:YafQ family addiction module toxin component